MTAASCAVHRAPPRCTESSFISWWLVGILLGALGFLLPTFSDACGEPLLFDSMTLKGVPKSSYSPGEKVYYYCKPGYYQLLFHSTNTYCEENGTWHPIPEGCTRKECTFPKVLNGGVLDPNYTVSMGFQFDKEFHFFCDEGYYLKGEKILTCKRSGDKVYWNYDLPKCEKIFCPSPGKIKNGKHTNSWRDIFEYNELVTYSCDPSNGPEEYSLVGDSKLICSGPGTWSTYPPECKVVKCEYPVLENGKLVSGIKEKFYYQAVVLFECLKGFYLHGSNPVFCGENNTWEPEMPTCIKRPVNGIKFIFLGFKPTHPTKPPVSRYPGYPNPSEFPLYEEFKELDPGIIALIILTILVGIAVICTCLYKCLHRNKKG